MVKQLGVPIQAFIAAATDLYRKPNTPMWDLFVKDYNQGVELDLKSCLYVGDAAGRIKGWIKDGKKDFSCGDRKFAWNIGVDFQTPEQFFLGESLNEKQWQWGSLDPVKYLESIPKDKKAFEGSADDLVSKTPEMVVMVGRPASGKSTFVKNYIVSQGYVLINRDTLKTQPKCLKATTSALDEGKSVVIDNTNPDSASRSKYIKIAEAKGVPVRCFWYNVEPDLASHLNFFREKVTNPSVRRIPDVAYRKYNSVFVEPDKEEGFTEVKVLSWVPNFKDKEHERLFKQWT